jgi:hypothetical protein
MRQNEITIGMECVVKIGSRFAPVTVLRELPTHYSRRRKFACMTHDTRREITATAARLRHAIGTPGDVAENARAAARQRRIGREQRAAEARPWTMPEGIVATVEDARPIPGMIARVGRLPVMRLNETDRAGVDRLVDRLHCAESPMAVCRRIRRGLERFQWRTIPATLRRAVLLAGLERHADNVAAFRDVMGHAPLPSERMVAEAVGVACGLGRMP